MRRCFTPTGHGAAPCSTLCNDETSYRARTSSGSANSWWNIVGTMCVWVTRFCSINRSASSGSHAGMSTTGTPAINGAFIENNKGAAWYSGPVRRCTLPSRYAARASITAVARDASSRKTPFGRPVVPDVYSICDPRAASSRSPVGSAATAAS